MTLTLAQAKVGTADKVVQSVIDEFCRGSQLLNALTFDNAVSPGTGGSTLTYGYTQLLTPTTAAGRALNSEYTAGEALRTKRTTDIKIFGGSFEVDRVLEGTAAKSEIAFQLDQKTKATTNLIHNMIINGDNETNTAEFDGLDVLLTDTDTEYEPTASIEIYNAAKIKDNAATFALELDTMISKLNSKPDMLLVNARTKLLLNAVAREMGAYTQTQDAFGAQVDRYNGIPIVDLENYYNGTTTVPVVGISATTGETSIYAVCLGLDGLHGVSPTGNKLVNAYLPDLKAPGAVKKGEVELLAGLALKASRAAGVLRKVQVNYIAPDPDTSGQ